MWAGPGSPDDGRWWLYQWRSDSIKGLEWGRTVLGFYVDDARFEAVYESPDREVAKMLNLGVHTVIAPNYSLWFGHSRAVHLYATFRSRWAARYMQEAGITVIPDVNWADESSFEFCTLGIPVGAPVLSVQLQTVESDAEKARACAGLELAVEMLRPERLMVVGHTAADDILRRIDLQCGIIRVGNRSSVRRKLMDTSQKG